MGMFELVDLMSSKNGDELFNKVTEILKQLGITVFNEDGSYKDTYTLICEISDAWNKKRSVTKIEI